MLYADHGNLMLPKETQLKNIKDTKVAADEELIQIPIAVKSNNNKGRVNELHSLMELNAILLELMNNNYKPRYGREYIKIGRSEIYNPQLKYLYGQMGCLKNLLAFEGFIFKDGFKLIVFSDGKMELYRSRDDELIDDQKKKEELFNIIKKKSDSIVTDDREFIDYLKREII